MKTFIYIDADFFRESKLLNLCMGNYYSNAFIRTLAFVALLLGFTSQEVYTQSYNDGPIELMVRLRDFNLSFPETDLALFGVVGQPDDLTYNVWARDNSDEDGVNWGAGSGCLVEDYVLPLTDFNTILFSHPYPGATVPQFVDIRLDAWEDESPDQVLGVGCQGTRCAYETGFCCGGFLFGICLGFNDDDDLRCDGNPYATLDYRLGPPCVWYDHGYLNGTCANDVYHPRIETFWRYTNGDNCGTPIALGNFAPGFSNVTHFNSNECYNDANPMPNGGRDVFYRLNVTQPVGIRFETCGTGSAQTAVDILDASCTSIASNFSGCGNGASISVPICNPGVYYVVVEGRLGSTGTFTLEISEDPGVIVTANAGADVFVCEGIGVTIGGAGPPTATGGQIPYHYTWSSPPFLNNDTIANPVAFPPTSQDFYLEVMDGNGCISYDTVNVTVNPGPTVALGPDPFVCANNPVLLDAGGGFSSYFWSTGSFNQTTVANDSGQYIAVVTDFNGCIGRDTVQVNYYNTPTVSLGADTAICAGSVVNLDAGAGFNTYTWSNAQSTQAITVTATGTYNVLATDGNGCDATDTIDVVVNQNPIISLGADTTLCPGEPAFFNPGAGYVTYAWNTGSPNQIINPTAPGNYFVNIIDTNGCTATDDVNLFNYTPTAPNIIGVNSICPGQFTTLDAGTGPATVPFVSYSWNNGATTQTISVQFPGDYFVTATDANGCESYDTITVFQSAVPTVDLGPEDTTVCSGTPVVLAVPNNGNAYNWSTGGSGFSVIVVNPGTYYVTATNAGGCTAVDSIEVFTSPLPTPTALNNGDVCPGDSLTLDPGSGFSSYAWSNGSNDQTITVGTPGTYTVTVSNPDGCTATTSMTLNQYNAVSVTLGGDRTRCEGFPFVLDAGNPGSTYQWNTGATTQTINVSFTGQYTVTVTSPNGCTGSDTMQATFNPLPVFSLGSDDTLCDGATITLDAGAGFASYAWSTGDNSQTIPVNTTGSYSVTVVDAVTGCSNFDDIEVVASTIPLVDLGPDITYCDSGFATIDAGPQYVSYTWSPPLSTGQFIDVDMPGNYSVTVVDQFDCPSTDDINVTAQGLTDLDFLPPLYEFCSGEDGLLDAGDQWEYYEWNNGSPDQYVVVTSSGSFDVIATDSNGCRFFDTIRVREKIPPTLELGPNPNICPDEVLTIDAGSGFDSYLWSTGEIDQTIDISGPGQYTVSTIFDGCEQTDELFVGDDCPGQIFIPNVFSPNNDDLNDYFQVTFVNLDYLTVKIYDRWGKFLYESNDKNFQWDGTYKSKPLPEGVYYWIIDYKLNTVDFEEQDKGTVTILR